MAKLKARSTDLENTCLTSDKATIRLQIPMLGRQKLTTPTRSVRHIEDSTRHFRYSITPPRPPGGCWGEVSGASRPHGGPAP
jgi:hypothetical protein